MVRAPGFNVTLDARKRQGPLLPHHITFADRDNRQPSLKEGVGTSSPQQARRTALGHGVSHATYMSGAYTVGTYYLVLFSRRGFFFGGGAWNPSPGGKRRDEECMTSLVNGIPFA